MAVALVLLPGASSLLVPPVAARRAPSPRMAEKKPDIKPKDALFSAIESYDQSMKADANRRTVVSSAAGVVFGVGFSKLISGLGAKKSTTPRCFLDAPAANETPRRPT